MLREILRLTLLPLFVFVTCFLVIHLTPGKVGGSTALETTSDDLKSESRNFVLHPKGGDTELSVEQWRCLWRFFRMPDNCGVKCMDNYNKCEKHWKVVASRYEGCNSLYYCIVRITHL